MGSSHVRAYSRYVDDCFQLSKWKKVFQEVHISSSTLADIPRDVSNLMAEYSVEPVNRRLQSAFQASTKYACYKRKKVPMGPSRTIGSLNSAVQDAHIQRVMSSYGL